MSADATVGSGSNFTSQFTITNTAGTAVTLTGGSFVYAVFNQAGTELFRKTSGTISGASNNIVSFSVVPVDTASLAGLYRHELKITDSSGNVTERAAFGTLIIEANLIV
jgi:hypothetical protein